MPTDKHRKFVEVTLAGVQHHAYKDRLSEIGPAEALALEAEPTNPYDHFAVKVLRGGELVGYIARSSIQQTVSNFLREGHTLVASLAKSDPKHPVLQVWMEKLVQ